MQNSRKRRLLSRSNWRPLNARQRCAAACIPLVKADTPQATSAKAEALRSKVSVSRAKADEAKASMAANRSENAVLSSLTKLKQQGRIKGFHVRPLMLTTGLSSPRRAASEILVLLTTNTTSL